MEDFVVFEDQESFKMDSSESRLRPKTDDEAVSDVANQEELQSNVQAKSVKVRMMTSDGGTIEVALPVDNFAEIVSISIVSE